MLEEITRLTEEGLLSLPPIIWQGFKSRKIAGVILYIEDNQIVIKPVKEKEDKFYKEEIKEENINKREVVEEKIRELYLVK